MLSTSDSALDGQCRWQDNQRQLIDSLRQHPLLVVLRPSDADWSVPTLEQAPLLRLIDQLVGEGVRHLEVAWVAHPRWPCLLRLLKGRYPTLQLGAASITSQQALRCALELDLAYVMSPCLDLALLTLARRHGQLLVPGVLSPSEVLQAAQAGCELVKLFPANTLGIKYLRQLSAPMDPLPHVIAAGGLTVQDLDPWLAAGHHAVALGRGVVHGDRLDPHLLTWLARQSEATEQTKGVALPPHHRLH
ncbi:MAG: bifunctional 4-hydroxy-2-oxoglutarate aldolase/2-dehydro-3-deoxy-phosphogluconate aldolase [Synechococcus sp.]